jgi:MFS family permease
MLQTYRAALRAPGAPAFTAAGFVARFSIAMYPIGLVLLISLRTGHYGFAGLLSGSYVIANGIGNPVLGRAVDRYGQRRVLVPVAIAHAGAVAVLVVLARTDAPDWSLMLPTVVFGFTYLAIGSLVRARWSHVLAGRPEMTTGYSLESTLDEVIFTAGPLLATVVATQLAPEWVFVSAAALVVVGSAWLRSQERTEPPVRSTGVTPHVSAMRTRGMTLLLLGTACMGAFFASAEVTMIAFCGQHGHTALAGLALACFAGGSAMAGFLYGARHRAAPILDRFRLQCLVFATLPWLFVGAVNIPLLAVIAFVVGTCIAPALITSFGLIESVVPAAALTEGMSWPITGLSVGYGVASAIVGRIADAHGARPAFGVAIGSAVLVGAIALALHRRLSVRVPAEVSAA